MSHRGIFAFSLLVACVFIRNGAHGLNVTDCGTSDKVKIRHVSVSNCDGADLCPLIRGNTTTLTIKFEVESTVKNMSAVVHGNMNGGDIFLTFPYKHKYACKEEMGLKCPLTPGKVHAYKAPIEILKLYPKVDSVVRWQLRDEKKDKLICILIPSGIVDP